MTDTENDMTNQKIVSELINMKAMDPILLVRATRLRFQLQKGLKPKKSVKVDKYKAMRQQFSLNLIKTIRRNKVIKPPEQLK